jgi:hypothetical protein
MRQISSNEVDLLVDQLEHTAAILAVLLEDVYEVTTAEVADKICSEMNNIFSILRDIEKGDLCDSEMYWKKLENFWERHNA